MARGLTDYAGLRLDAEMLIEQIRITINYDVEPGAPDSEPRGGLKLWQKRIDGDYIERKAADIVYDLIHANTDYEG